MGAARQEEGDQGRRVMARPPAPACRPSHGPAARVGQPGRRLVEQQGRLHGPARPASRHLCHGRREPEPRASKRAGRLPGPCVAGAICARQPLPALWLTLVKLTRSSHGAARQGKRVPHKVTPDWKKDMYSHLASAPVSFVLEGVVGFNVTTAAEIRELRDQLHQVAAASARILSRV